VENNGFSEANSTKLNWWLMSFYLPWVYLVTI